MSVLQFDCRFQYPHGFQLELAFEACPGVTALVGPSGSGKTTTLHLIAGLLRPSGGSIVVGERVLFDAARKVNVPVERRRVGLVHQDYQLFPHLSVEHNLKFGWRRNGGDIRELARMIDVLELGPLLLRMPAALSGGQQQRVALGRALLSRPALLLLDEPLSALDAALRRSILHDLRMTLLRYPVPTLLVTHDEASIEVLAATVVRMPAG